MASLKSIDFKDKRFSVSYPLSDERLLASIRKAGIIEPLILLEGPTRSSVISGFKRLWAARVLGIKAVPAVAVSVTNKEALMMAIHSNVMRGFNVVERSHVLEKMAVESFSLPELEETMTMMSMPMGPHEKVLALHHLIATAGEPLKAFIVDKTLSMKTIEYLFRFARREQKQIVAAFTSKHATESQIREILEMLFLLKVKKGKVDTAIFRENMDTQDLRVKLKRRLQPGLTTLEEHLAKIIKEAALPPAIDIKVDPFFEKEYIDIVIRTRDNAEAQNLLNKTEAVLQQGYIRSILELTKGRVR